MSGNKTTGGSQHVPTRVRDKPRSPYLTKVLFAAPMLSAFMLAMGLINLIGAGTLIDWAKIIVIALAAFVISYAVYRLAIEKGAPLAARGISSAGLISVLSITFVATGLWMGTYPGLALPGVEERRLQEYVVAKSDYAQEQSSVATSAARLVPLVTSISADLSQKFDCEVASSCVSGSGSGGYGPTARVLENLAARARAVADEASGGLAARDTLLDELAGLMRAMQETLVDESLSIWERRTQLRQLDTQVGQVLERLEGAVPAAMVMAYGAELRAGIELPNSPGTANTINRYLSGYADSLEVVLGDISAEDAANPVFPPRSGAWETFSYIGQYAPVALLTLAIELVFPLALWAFTLLTLLWERYRDDPDGERQAEGPTEFDRLTNRPIENTPQLVSDQSLNVRRARARSARRR